MAGFIVVNVAQSLGELMGLIIAVSAVQKWRIAMTEIIAFIIGLAFGAFGIIVIALAISGGDDDDHS